MAILSFPKKPAPVKRGRISCQFEVLPAPPPHPKDQGPYEGVLTVNGTVFKDRDGQQLGFIAFICGVNTLKVSFPGTPAALPLRGTTQHERWLDQLPNPKIALLLKRFHAALYCSRNSARQSEGMIRWWREELFPPALARVPEPMRVRPMLALAPLGYNPDGQPQTAKDVERAAQHHQMLEAFASLNAMLAGDATARDKVAASIGITPVPWEHVVGIEGQPHGPVAINGPAYPAVNKLLKRFGFKRMPDTFAELAEGVQFCNDMEKLCRAGANGVRDEALIAVRMRYLKRDTPERLPLAEACLGGDGAVLLAVQARQDWLTVLATRYDPHRDGPSV